MKICISKNKKDIYIIPARSRDNKSSTFPLKYLETKDTMHPQLKQLIKLASSLS